MAAMLLIPVSGFSQTFAITDTFTVNEMLGQLFGAGVTVSNVTVAGDTNSAIGYFTGGNSFGLDEGIILSTGSALSVAGSGFGGSVLGMPGDPDLAALTGYSSLDAFVLEFDLVSSCDTILMEYVFGSQEYPAFVGSGFNDAFAFWITGPGYSGMTNIALVPGTNIPVSINTVNNATSCVNCQYYVSNTQSQTALGFGGHTVPLLAIATVIPDSTYHVKIAISDMLDYAYDSGVLLRRKGVCGNPNLVQINGNSAAAASIQVAEGASTMVHIERALPFDQSVTLTFATAGNASLLDDVLNWPSTLTIPAGASSVDLNVQVASDCEVEGMEKLAIIYTDSSLTCGGAVYTDTIWIDFADANSALPALDLGPDFSACLGDTVWLDDQSPSGYTLDYSPNVSSTGLGYWLVTGNDSTPETFTFWATLSDSVGCSVADTASILATPPPQAAMILPDVVCDGAAFDGLDASTGFVESYEWFFYSSGSATWTYNTPNVNVQFMPVEWSVQFTVGNAACGFDTALATVQVYPAVDYLNLLEDSVCVNEEVVWSYYSTDPMVQYAWNFGNGALSTETTPTYAYADTGSYQIEVVSGYPGCLDTLVATVAVEACATDGLERPWVGLSVYPNPASDVLHIEGLGDSEVAISLYDLRGREIYHDRSSVPSRSLSLRDLPAGVYWLRIAQEDRIWRGKVQVTK